MGDAHKFSLCGCFVSISVVPYLAGSEGGSHIVEVAIREFRMATFTGLNLHAAALAVSINVQNDAVTVGVHRTGHVIPVV